MSAECDDQVYCQELRNSYFCRMQLRTEYKELVDFFLDRELPQGPQHLNEYSVFFNLPGAVNTHLQRLHSEVEATRQSAVLLLQEVREWLIGQE